MTLAEVKAQLREGSYTWPGSYPKFFLMGDGETMHVDCVRARWRDVVRAKAFHDRAFICDACGINWEDEHMLCAECNKPIECAYEGASQ